MKKINPSLAEDKIDLVKLIKLLRREKILVLSVSTICGLLGYLYAFFNQEFMTRITIKHPPPQLFELYTSEINNRVIISERAVHAFLNLTPSEKISLSFFNEFRKNFLSINNLQKFTDESRGLDNFKGYLKSRNISTKDYFEHKIYEKQTNSNDTTQFFFTYTKELNVDNFLENYVEFVKKKTLFEIKKNIKLSVENQIFLLEKDLETAKLINLTNPIVRQHILPNQLSNELNTYSNFDITILSQEIIYLKKLLTKLEKEEFNYNIIVDKQLISSVNKDLNIIYSGIGIIFGLFLSLGFIFFKNILKNN